MSLPALLPNGYLPPGIHEATLSEVVEGFVTNTPRRQVLASRLQELVSLAQATTKLQHLFIWGSFVTDKPFPRDLDIFLLMQEGFDREFAALSPPQQYIFAYGRARLLFRGRYLLGYRGRWDSRTGLVAERLSALS
ncbi:MAG TPA: hypothetical protein VIH59_04080 [Candidatus Tectomicrobia bacterium]|jgi:hypothetical protein